MRDFLQGTQQKMSRAGNALPVAVSPFPVTSGKCPVALRLPALAPSQLCVTVPQPQGRALSRYSALCRVLTTHGSETTWPQVTAGLGLGLARGTPRCSFWATALFVPSHPSRLVTSLGITLYWGGGPVSPAMA